MITKILTSCAVAAALSSAPAFAQSAPESVGTVSGVEGEVIVARGADTYPLKEGDLLFPGDRVITRTDGTVTIASAGCSQSLSGASSIVVDAQFCNKSPIQLAQGDQAIPPVQGGGVGVGAAAGGVGLAVAAAALAANGGGGNGVENSPIPVSP